MLPIVHNVYTSINGYRTVFVSREAGERAAKLFNQFANRAYKRIGNRTARGIMRYAGGASIHFKGFQHGSDHVGRPRTCVHIVSVMPQVASSVPFFEPILLDLNSVFMTDKTPLNGFSERFPHAIDVPDMAQAHEQLAMRAFNHINGSRPADLPPVNLFLQMLSCVMTPGAKLVLIGAEPVALNVLLYISALLPTGVRMRLGYVTGRSMDIHMPGVASAEVLMVSPNGDIPSLLPQMVQFDFTQRRISGSIAPDPWAVFLRELAVMPDGAARLLRYQWLLEKYTGTSMPDPSMVEQIVLGIKRLDPVIGDKAVIRPLFFPEISLTAIKPLLRGGLKLLAKELLLSVCESIRRKHGDAMSPEIRDLVASGPALVRKTILNYQSPLHDEELDYHLTKFAAALAAEPTPVDTAMASSVSASLDVEFDTASVMDDHDPLPPTLSASDAAWDISKFDLDDIQDDVVDIDAIDETKYDLEMVTDFDEPQSDTDSDASQPDASKSEAFLDLVLEPDLESKLELEPVEEPIPDSSPDPVKERTHRSVEESSNDARSLSGRRLRPPRHKRHKRTHRETIFLTPDDIEVSIEPDYDDKPDEDDDEIATLEPDKSDSSSIRIPSEALEFDGVGDEKIRAKRSRDAVDSETSLDVVGDDGDS